jgi:16S rRNA (uracil1498-N3)-methyltransferase
MAELDRSALRSTSSHVLVDADLLGDAGTISLDDEVERHLNTVLRLRNGESVSVTDGDGRWCLAVVVRSGAMVRLEPSSEVFTEATPQRSVTIAAAIPKGDRLDWMVQKVTELGVDRLVLVNADRSVVRWKPDRVDRQLVRLHRIADEALRQSRRVTRLAIDMPRPALEVLSGFVIAEPGGRSLVVADTAVAVGPEGGWSDAELAAAKDRVDLGSTILRTETAAVAVAARCVAFGPYGR